MRHFSFHCETSRGLLSNILSSSEEVASVAVVVESLIFGIALSLTDEEVRVTGDGVRERSELATDDDDKQQSGPVDIGSGEDGDEAVEHLEVNEEEDEGFGFGGDLEGTL